MVTQIPASSTSILFQGRANSNQTLGAANSVNLVALQVNAIDDANGHSTSTATTRYVIQRAGLYSISGSLLWNGADATTGGTTARTASVAKNGTVINGSVSWFAHYGVAFTQHTVPVYATLAINDYIELRAIASLAGAILAGDATQASTLRVELIR